MKKLIMILLTIFLLTSCDKDNPYNLWEALTSTPYARTDRVTFPVTISNITRKSLDSVCGRHSNGCVKTTHDGSKIVFIHGYQQGLKTREITVQFLSWNDVPKKCGGIFRGTSACTHDGVIYTYDYPANDVENIWANDTITSRSDMGVIGGEIAKQFDFKPNQFNWEQVIGHEVMAHVIPAEIQVK